MLVSAHRGGEIVAVDAGRGKAHSPAVLCGEVERVLIGVGDVDGVDRVGEDRSSSCKVGEFDWDDEIGSACQHPLVATLSGAFRVGVGRLELPASCSQIQKRGFSANAVSCRISPISAGLAGTMSGRAGIGRRRRHEPVHVGLIHPQYA